MPFGVTGTAGLTSPQPFPARQLQQQSAGGSVSGQKFLPFQQSGRQAGIDFILGQLPNAAEQANSLLDENGQFLRIGGENTQFTDIPVQGVFTPQQIQENVNTIRAQSQADSAGQLLDLRNRAGGANFGTGPLSANFQESSQNILGRALAARLGAETDFRTSAARDNAQQLLASAQAQTNVERARSQDDIARRQIEILNARDFFGRENALLNALGQFTNPLSFSNQFNGLTGLRLQQGLGLT